jgi:hypothetical protein
LNAYFSSKSTHCFNIMRDYFWIGFYIRSILRSIPWKSGIKVSKVVVHSANKLLRVSIKLIRHLLDHLCQRL